MTVARNVADVLDEHVTFEVECIDRMFLNVYVPQLQYPNGLVGYVHRQLGLPIASTAPLARITDRFAAAVHRFAEDDGIIETMVDLGEPVEKGMVLARIYSTGRTGVCAAFSGSGQSRRLGPAGSSCR